MSERKVLNKYIPPDFDPELIPRFRGPKKTQQVVRLMAPFSMRCNTCGEYIYKGKKFNARKETADGEDYLGLRIFRFYIKCTLCSAEITFKTDPKNTDYVAEHGASRNFEPWRDEAETDEIDRIARLEEEENNPMKALENRTTDSKREMAILDALQDIRARNARNERMGKVEEKELLDKLGIEEDSEEDELDAQKRLEEEEDERLVREVFAKVTVPTASSALGGDATQTVTVKRKALDLEPASLDSLLPESTRSLINSKISGAGSSTSTAAPPAKKKKLNALGIKVVSKKAAVK